MASEDKLAKRENNEVTRRQQVAEYYQPAVDISETEHEIIMKYDMPGVSKDNVEITAEKNTLTVIGKVEAKELGSSVYCETRTGDYKREFAIPDDVDPESISAEIKNGVLTIKISKPEKAKPKKIEVLCS